MSAASSLHRHVLRSLGLASAAFLLVLPLAAFPTTGSAEISPQLRDLAEKGDRLALQRRELSLLEVCSGQAWGEESVECLLTIAEIGGKDELRSVRIVARGEPDRDLPNIFLRRRFLNSRGGSGSSS